VLEYKTKDHPEANGRKAVVGEQQWCFTFFLEDGTVLKVLAGRTCHDSFKAMLEQEEIDDLAASEPAGN